MVTSLTYIWWFLSISLLNILSSARSYSGTPVDRLIFSLRDWLFLIICHSFLEPSLGVVVKIYIELSLLSFLCPFLFRQFSLKKTSLFTVCSLHYLMCFSLLYFPVFRVSGVLHLFMNQELLSRSSRRCLIGWLPNLVNIFLAFIPIVSAIGFCLSPWFDIFWHFVDFVLWPYAIDAYVTMETVMDPINVADSVNPFLS